MEAWQIRFKNGNVIEFASFEDASAYAVMHGLKNPTRVKL